MCVPTARYFHGSFYLAILDIRSMWDNDCVGIIVGDFNQPEIEWNATNPVFTGLKSLALHDMYTDLGCEQFIMSPTRGGNILDLLFCNDHMLISDISIGAPFSTSDHSTINFTVCLFCQTMSSPNDVIFEARPDWEKADWTALRDFFDNFPWEKELLNKTGLDSNDLCYADYILAWY